MKYELAKELKDKGFPQIHDYGKTVWCESKDYSFIINDSDDYDTTGKLPFKDNQSSGMAEGFVSIPTLSELIEACGEGFNDLNHSGGHRNWYARSGVSIIVSGKTPEEAVAKLWLALNKK